MKSAKEVVPRLWGETSTGELGVNWRGGGGGSMMKEGKGRGGREYGEGEREQEGSMVKEKGRRKGVW